MVTEKGRVALFCKQQTRKGNRINRVHTGGGEIDQALHYSCREDQWRNRLTPQGEKI